MFGVFIHEAHAACAFLFEQLQPADIGHDNEFTTKRPLTNDELAGMASGSACRPHADMSLYFSVFLGARSDEP
jgi:hypothetical protein